MHSTPHNKRTAAKQARGIKEPTAPSEGGDPGPRRVTAAPSVMASPHTHTHRSLFWYCFISILEFHSFNTEALFHYTKMSLMFMSKCFFSPQRTFCYRKSWVQNKNKGMDCHCAVDMGGRTFSSASHGKGEECGQEARWRRRATSDTSKSRSSHWFPRWLGFFAYF